MDKSMTVTLLESALRGTSLRSKAIANNIANIQTPNYRRKEVEFGHLLEKALQDGKAAVADVEPLLFAPKNSAVDATGNDVDLDTEFGHMIENGALHKTYLRLMTKMYKQMDMAIRGDGI